jgi:5'-methylthioadenosine phosphorylase
MKFFFGMVLIYRYLKNFNMINNKLAIIGGSGLYDVEDFKEREFLKIDTPWGQPSDDILKTKYNNKEIYFLPRHGRGHTISPTKINFRANIDALKQLGVTDIVSVSAVGSLKEDLSPGKFVIIDQFIDRTFARNKTFFDDEIVAHVSMAHPTSNGLMNSCEEAIKQENIEYQRGGTYVVMEGPQFSTLAESRLYRSWNADVIGMTNMPEAKLAREAEIRYASVSMVTDFDCWHPDHENVDVQKVVKVLLSNAEKAKGMIKNIINNFESHIDTKDPTNNCLDVAIITSPERRTQKTIDKLKNVAGRFFKK